MVSYNALVLTDSSKKKLIGYFNKNLKKNIPLDITEWNSYFHHVTIDMGKSKNPDFLDCSIGIQITGIGFSDTNIAVKVNIKSKIIQSTNEIPHITLFVSPLGKPYGSNKITNWVDIENGLEISGLYKELGDKNNIIEKSILENNLPYQLFLDLDGVFADFDTSFKNIMKSETDKKVFYKKLHYIKDFWSSLGLLPNALNFWNEVKDYSPVILTGIVASDTYCIPQKRQWVRKNLSDIFVITCNPKEKWKYMVPNKVNILIDDKQENCDKWIEHGGEAILYTDDNWKQIFDQLKFIIEESVLADKVNNGI